MTTKTQKRQARIAAKKLAAENVRIAGELKAQAEAQNRYEALIAAKRAALPAEVVAVLEAHGIAVESVEVGPSPRAVLTMVPGGG